MLRRLEETLAERIGRDAVAALRAALETPWGPAPAADPGTTPPRP